MSVIETIIDIPVEHERKVCGPFDSYLKKIERTLHVSMIARDGEIKIIGPDHAVKRAKSVFSTLISLSKRGEDIGEQNVDYALALSFEGKRLDNVQQRQIADVIMANSSVEILCILSQDDEEEARHRAAVETKLQAEKANTGRFYKGTLRSGQVLESEGSVVILGDVNPGSKVIAVGNVIVLGSLKGTACAGITGNERCFIAALEMDPTQLRIGNVLGRGGDSNERRRGPVKPKIAFCGEDGLYVEELCRDVLHDIQLD